MTRFQRLEKEQGLFDQLVLDRPWWDSVRFNVFKFLEEKLTECNPEPCQPSKWRRLISSARSAVSRRKLYRHLSQNQGKILFIRAPRTRQGDKISDRILDPIMALFPNETQHIDTIPRRYHVPSVQMSSRSGSVPKTLGETLKIFAATFDLSQDHVDMLEQTIRVRRHVFEVELEGYRRLLDLASPKLLVLVQNGIEKSLFLAAKERGIPTVEAQHGLIDFSHPAYSYAPDISYDRQATFPDLFLTFSEHWELACHYPAGASISVGNDSLCPALTVVQKIAAVMIVSSYLHQASLAPWVKKVAESIPERRIIYKLHPNQAAVADSITAEFDDLPNVDVISHQTSTSTLMKEVSHVVAVNSTVVYEALQAGRRVLLIPELNYRSHCDIFDLPEVEVPLSPAELVRALAKPCLAGKPVRFFDRFDHEKTREILSAYMTGTPLAPGRTS